MGLRSDSAAGTRFLAAAHEGRGIKPAARSVGVHPWTGYRWLREAFLVLRRNALDVEAAQAELGCCTAKAQVWDEEFLRSAPSWSASRWGRCPLYGPRPRACLSRRAQPSPHRARTR